MTRSLYFESHIVNKLPERGSMYRRGIETIEKKLQYGFKMLSIFVLQRKMKMSKRVY